MFGSRLDLGVGVVGLHGIDLIWSGIADLVDVVEVEPQTLWTEHPGEGWRLRESAFDWYTSRKLPLLCHGVGFPVGGTEPPNPTGVELAAESARQLGAVHWSEHLSFNRAKREGQAWDAGYLLSPRQTWATVEAAVANIGCYQRQLDLPFLVETATSYLRPAPNELHDGQFIAEVVERADCAILLDLHNLWANERNGRQTVADVLAALPLERVLEVHLAGGFELNSYYLDAHIGGVAPELLEIARTVLPALPNVRAVMFEAVPESLVTLGASGVRRVLEQLHDTVEASPPASRRPPQVDRRAPDSAPISPVQAPALVAAATPAELAAEAEWEASALLYVSRGLDQPPDDDPGFDLLRELTAQARLSRVARARPDLVDILVQRHRPEELQAVAQRFLGDRPAHFGIKSEGESFAAWLKDSEAEAAAAGA